MHNCTVAHIAFFSRVERTGRSDLGGSGGFGGAPSGSNIAFVLEERQPPSELGRREGGAWSLRPGGGGKGGLGGEWTCVSTEAVSLGSLLVFRSQPTATHMKMSLNEALEVAATTSPVIMLCTLCPAQGPGWFSL